MLREAVRRGSAKGDPVDHFSVNACSRAPSAGAIAPVWWALREGRGLCGRRAGL